jgi:hypothetical protein
LSSDPPVLHRLSPPAVGIVPGHDHTSRLARGHHLARVISARRCAISDVRHRRQGE